MPPNGDANCARGPAPRPPASRRGRGSAPVTAEAADPFLAAAGVLAGCTCPSGAYASLGVPRTVCHIREKKRVRRAGRMAPNSTIHAAGKASCPNTPRRGRPSRVAARPDRPRWPGPAPSFGLLNGGPPRGRSHCLVMTAAAGPELVERQSPALAGEAIDIALKIEAGPPELSRPALEAALIRLGRGSHRMDRPSRAYAKRVDAVATVCGAGDRPVASEQPCAIAAVGRRPPRRARRHYQRGVGADGLEPSRSEPLPGTFDCVSLIVVGSAGKRPSWRLPSSAPPRGRGRPGGMLLPVPSDPAQHASFFRAGPSLPRARAPSTGLAAYNRQNIAPHAWGPASEFARAILVAEHRRPPFLFLHLPSRRPNAFPPGGWRRRGEAGAFAGRRS